MKEASKSISSLFKSLQIAFLSFATKRVLINTLHKKGEVKNHENWNGCPESKPTN